MVDMIKSTVKWHGICLDAKRIPDYLFTAWRKSLTESYMPIIAEEINARQTPSAPIHPARMVAQVREVVGDFDKLIEVNLAKEKHRAIKTAVSFI